MSYYVQHCQKNMDFITKQLRDVGHWMSLVIDVSMKVNVIGSHSRNLLRILGTDESWQPFPVPQTLPVSDFFPADSQTCADRGAIVHFVDQGSTGYHRFFKQFSC